MAVKSKGKVLLRSRNNKDFNGKYPGIVRALAALPEETVIDGEVVALDDAGRPSFNLLQNAGGSKLPIVYYVFDLLILAGKNVTSEVLSKRRDLLSRHVLSKLREPIRESSQLNASFADIIKAVKAHGFEGIVAKRLDSRYESGQRSGAWQKMRINQGQEFVIGGYTPSPKNFDALIFGYYEGDKLLYAARTRAGFTPASRTELYRRLRPLEISECPFVNLPEERAGRWGQGLTAEKMKECRWLNPAMVGQFEFVEWTPDGHLRHSRFVGVRTKRDPKLVGRK